MRSVLTKTGAGFFLVVLTAFCAAAQQSAGTAKKLDSGYCHPCHRLPGDLR